MQRQLSFLILFLPFLAGAQQNERTMQQIDSLFHSYFKAGEPGGAMLLVKNGTVVYQQAAGVADMKTGEAITVNTLFNVGSISKTFVSYGILKLASEGKLSLEDPLLKYFPDFEHPNAVEKVRLFNLLTHTSGIPDSRKVKDEWQFYLTAKDAENFQPLKATRKLEFEPGTDYKYSNPAFNGLALIIEKVTGKKWQDYISDLIFRSAGMAHSTITDGPHPETGVSHAYVLNKEKGFDELDYGEEPTFAAAGNGGIWSSVEELWKYEQAIQAHVFLDSNWINRSRTLFPFPGWKGAIPSRLGLSWFLTEEGGVRIQGHTGSQGGFISDYCWLPDQKVFYVLLCNIPKPIKDIRNKLFTILGNADWLGR
jgi:CubicO group peptidase (beta-lactamase class C family)